MNTDGFRSRQVRNNMIDRTKNMIQTSTDLILNLKLASDDWVAFVPFSLSLPCLEEASSAVSPSNVVESPRDFMERSGWNPRVLAP